MITICSSAVLTTVVVSYIYYYNIIKKEFGNKKYN